ncbi:MAG TPA: hypothetical protein VIK04_02560, partial [Solirubrobacteraceae bacterium]
GTLTCLRKVNVPAILGPERRGMFAFVTKANVPPDPIGARSGTFAGPRRAQPPPTMTNRYVARDH